ncbi:hypothetical protein BCR42DRAFT_405876 [Absidia repens]|uniref:FAR1 domain-containing protein n=1 Tax=Absidia repens TaxID=90262 RepID=A0A1X2IU20_9FUNG|nr:hypothetical protein BCR42DRAFT_405876 [Absidia repens]
MSFLLFLSVVTQNIYVYCSREGLPDSQRNPKSNPQRKRPSKRCDCRWRVVLYENSAPGEKKGGSNSIWQFRKSQNPAASKHNHELMRPEEIDKGWPSDMLDLICELARQRLPTQEIRSRVKSQFASITWNERRFYNRLSDERQKIKCREAEQRARHLTGIWTKICMAAAGHEELADFVEDDIIKLLHSVCKSSNIDESSLTVPSSLSSSTTNIASSTDVSASSATNSTTATATDPTTQNTTLFTRFVDQSPENPQQSKQPKPSAIAKAKAPEPHDKTTANTNKPIEPPKGCIMVDIPQHSYFVKIHTQRAGSIGQVSIAPPSASTTTSAPSIDTIEAMIRNPRRTRSPSTDVMGGNARKTPRKGKSRQPSTSLAPSSMGLDNAIGNPLQRLHNHPGIAAHQQQHRPPHPLSVIANESTMHPPPPETTTFIYSHFDAQGMPLDTTSLSPYVPFQNTYNISTNSGGFASDMSFQFDPPSPTPIGSTSSGNEQGRSANDNTSHNNEPTIHPALQSNPMAHHERQRHHPLQPKLDTHHHQNHHSSSTAPSGMTIETSAPHSRQLYSTTMRHSDGSVKLTQQQQHQQQHHGNSPTGTGTSNLAPQQYASSFVHAYSPTTSSSQSTASSFHAHHTPTQQHQHQQHQSTDQVLGTSPSSTQQQHQHSLHHQNSQTGQGLMARKESSSSLGN